MKRYAAAMLALILWLGLLPARADTLARAWRKAALHVPAAAMPETVEEEDGIYRFLFHDEVKLMRYEVEVFEQNALFKQMLITAETVRPAGSVAVTGSRVRQQVMERVPDAEILGLYLQEQPEGFSYLVSYAQADKGYFHQTVYEAGKGRLMNSLVTLLDGQDRAGLSKALAVAAERFPGGTVIAAAAEQIGPLPVYLLKVHVGGQEHQLSLNALTGDLMGLTSADSQLRSPEPSAAGKGQAAASSRVSPPGRPDLTPPAQGTPPAAQPPSTAKPGKSSGKHGRPTPTPDQDDDDDDDDGDDLQDDD